MHSSPDEMTPTALAALLPVAPIRIQYISLNILHLYTFLRVCSSSGQSPERWLDGIVSNPIIRFYYDHEELWCFYYYLSLEISEKAPSSVETIDVRVLSLSLVEMPALPVVFGVG